MKTFYSRLLLAIVFIGFAITANAVPAYPGLIQMKQPDGTTISLYLKGDEKVHWMESEDGYSLLYDNNRSIVYAISDETGDMVPSAVVARDISSRTSTDRAFINGISKQLRYSSAQVNTLKSIWTMVQESTKNENLIPFRAAPAVTHAICALANFNDKSMAKSSSLDAFNNLLNQVGYGSSTGDKGSVHDYYVENSYGQVNLVITVAGPYTVSKNWVYYGANDPNTKSDYPARVQEFATEVANFTFNDKTVNPADYDNNGDGIIDAFHIIYAGYGEEAGGGADCIWAHKFGFYPALTYGSVNLKAYSCSPELSGNSGTAITHIGVVCHEMCHIFGSPDFYDTSGSKNPFAGTGKWDLMAGGSWNNDGACPAHVNMYEKIQLGWVTPTVLNQAQPISGMLNSAENPVAYRYDTNTPGEYFVLENRQKKGFDLYVPGNGLLIYHASPISNSDLTSNTVNAGSLQKMYPVCASATTNPSGTPASYGAINSPGCPFPGSSNKTSFTDYTIPSATSWKGANTLKPVTEIQQKDGMISFNFMMPDAIPVTGLQVDTTNQKVQLSWTKPSDNSVIGYNIYRNNSLLINLTKDATSYTQYNVSSGTYSYCVTALYTGKESTPVCQDVTITNSSAGGGSYLTVQNLSAQNVNQDIQLDWQTPFVNSWITFSNLAETENAAYLDPTITKFSAVVRFTTGDLQKYQGSSLTKVRFYIPKITCKYTVQVWYATPDSFPKGNPLVSQLVTNPTKPDPTFDVTLNDTVPLVPNQELWIGIQCELSPMDYVAGCDVGPMVPDRNYAYIDNTWYGMQDGDDAVNWFIFGYLDFGSNTLNAPANTWLRAATATATNYIVYRDSQKITTTTKPTYVDSQPPFGDHIYCVSIAYSDGTESEQTCVEAISTNNVAITPVENPDGILNIFPNPVNRGGTLIIRCDPQTSSTLSFYSISGQLIQQEQVTGPEVQKIMNFEPGIYIMQIKDNSKSFIRKIIIK